MKPKQQRLALVGVALAVIAGASTLAVSALGETATYFYSPSDVLAKGVALSEEEARAPGFQLKALA